MDSEDICLSVFLCICVDEGIGDKSKSIYPLVFTDEGIGDKSKSIILTDFHGRWYVRLNQVEYTLHLCTSGRR